MNVLLCHPEQLKEVAENHDLIPQMIEEVLRYDTPILSIPRRAAVDVECDTVRIHALQKGASPVLGDPEPDEPVLVTNR